MLKQKILFKAAPVSLYEDDDSTVIVLSKQFQPVRVNKVAAALLLNYLQVIKAYFINGSNSKKITFEFYSEIVKYLNQAYTIAGGALDRPHISAIIERMGCVTDWQQQYPQLQV